MTDVSGGWSSKLREMSSARNWSGHIDPEEGGWGVPINGGSTKLETQSSLTTSPLGEHPGLEDFDNEVAGGSQRVVAVSLTFDARASVQVAV